MLKCVVMREKRIVLLHGWGAGTEKLTPLLKEFEKRNWQVYLAKLPGFDFSAPKYAWGVDDYSKYINEKAKRIFGNNNFFVFGHSFGGRIAIKMAIINPMLLKGLILCSVGGISRGYKIVRLFFYLLAKTGKIFLIIPPLALIWRKLLYKLAGEHDYEKSQGVMREVFKKVVSEDLKPYVSLINIPTLILWGKLDRVTPVKDAYFINKKVNVSKIIIFNNLGHRLPYEKPEEVAKEIDKWSKSLS